MKLYWKIMQWVWDTRDNKFIDKVMGEIKDWPVVYIHPKPDARAEAVLVDIKIWEQFLAADPEAKINVEHHTHIEKHK